MQNPIGRRQPRWGIAPRGRLRWREREMPLQHGEDVFHLSPAGALDKDQGIGRDV